MKSIHPLLSGLLLAALAGPTAAVAEELALFASGAGRGGAGGEDASKCDTASFSSAVVPATRSAFGSFFYNAFFEPSSEPLWTGHLEAYRLSAAGEILDSAGQPAVETSSGAFLEPRQPFWDAGTELLANTARKLYTTRSGRRVCEVRS